MVILIFVVIPILSHAHFGSFLDDQFKRLYYPLEMFADSRIIWSTIQLYKPDAIIHHCIPTSQALVCILKDSICDPSLCPNYLVVPHISIKDKLKRFAYPGEILVGYTPRLSNYGRKKIFETYCISTLDTILHSTSHCAFCLMLSFLIN